MNPIPASLYSRLFTSIITLASLLLALSIQKKGAYSLINRKHSMVMTTIFVCFITLFLGLRPSSGLFVDMETYGHLYYQLQIGDYPETFMESDPLFAAFMLFCSRYFDVGVFFFIVEVLYIIPVYLASRRLSKWNADIMMLFVFGAFSFFSYGVNGIRNGMALSLVMLALTFLHNKMKTKDWLAFVVLSIVASLFHKSSILPIICAFVSFFVKSPKWFFRFWILSIFVSLITGNLFGELFGSLGFDDRLSYLTNEVDEEMFNRVGFRWDFLLYSSMPILLGWYIIYKKRLFDDKYKLLLGTYILSNAFWILVIRAEYSNRFAYLSWFLYPIVLSYPLLKLPIWKNSQGQKLSIIMLLHLGFTILLSIR